MFKISIHKEPVEGTQLNRRVAYVLTFNAETVEVANVSHKGDMIAQINRVLNQKYPYLRLDAEVNKGLPNTVLQTVGGIEPYLGLEVHPEEELTSFAVWDDDRSFKHNFDILCCYINNLNNALEAINVMASKGNLDSLFIQE